MSKINLKEIKEGDIFSEISHYIYKGKTPDKRHEFTHLASNSSVFFNDNYVQDILSTADQYEIVKKVGKEDKKDGTPGIRTIFEGIHSSQVFTVWFRKQDKPLTKTKYKELKEEQISGALEAVEKAQKGKKGVLEAAKVALQYIQNNPVLDFEPGELRQLRGYKLQFTSRDGKYNCFDMDFPDGTKAGGNIRPVNINTIEALVFQGVKYELE